MNDFIGPKSRRLWSKERMEGKKTSDLFMQFLLGLLDSTLNVGLAVCSNYKYKHLCQVETNLREVFMVILRDRKYYS